MKNRPSRITVTTLTGGWTGGGDMRQTRLLLATRVSRR